MIGGIFTIGYLLYICSVVRLVRANDVALEAMLVGRIFMYAASIFLLALAYTKARKNLPIWPVIALPFLLPFVITAAGMHYMELLVAMSTAVLCLDRDGHRNLKIVAIAGFCLVVLVGALGYFELIPNLVVKGKQAAGSGWSDLRQKNSLGFDNPNNSFYFLFSSAYLFFLLNERRWMYLVGLVMAVLLPVVQNKTYPIAFLFLVAAPYFSAEKVFTRFAVRAMFVSTFFVGLLSTIIPQRLISFSTEHLGVDRSMYDRITSLRATKVLALAEKRDLLSLLFGGKPNPGDSLFLYFIEVFGVVPTIGLFFLMGRAINILLARGKTTQAVAVAIIPMIGLMEAPISGHAPIMVGLIFVIATAYQSRSLARRPAFSRHEGAMEQTVTP